MALELKGLDHDENRVVINDVLLQVDEEDCKQPGGGEPHPQQGGGEPCPQQGGEK